MDPNGHEESDSGISGLDSSKSGEGGGEGGQTDPDSTVDPTTFGYGEDDKNKTKNEVQTNTFSPNPELDPSVCDNTSSTINNNSSTTGNIADMIGKIANHLKKLNGLLRVNKEYETKVIQSKVENLGQGFVDMLVTIPEPVVFTIKCAIQQKHQNHEDK